MWIAVLVLMRGGGADVLHVRTQEEAVCVGPDAASGSVGRASPLRILLGLGIKNHVR